MKIRGNAVGTTISPKKIAERIGVTASYYNSLHDALNDINALTTGKVKVTGSTITLVEDLEETELLTFNADIELALNGHKLTMRDGGDKMTVIEGASLYIDGTKDGSAILADANSNSATLARVHGALSINGGQYSLANCSGTSAVFVATGTSPAIRFHGCTVFADGDENSVSDHVIGIQSQAKKLEICDAEMVLSGNKTTSTQYMNEANMYSVKITSTAARINNGIIAFPNSSTTLSNARFFSEALTGSACGLQIQAGATVTAEDLHISVVIHAEPEVNVSALGVYNSGNCTLDSAIILADSKYGHSEGACSIGINNIGTGTLTCRNTNSTATLAGIQNSGNLFASRCLLSGVTHGGLYALHDHDKEVVVNDTVLEVGVYRGQFTDVYADILDGDTNPGSVNTYAGMYFGSSDITGDGGDIHMDSCIFVGLAHEAFVIRAAAYNGSGALAPGLNPNRLFISRSKIAVQKAGGAKGQAPLIRLNRDDGLGIYQAPYAEMYCGAECNFNADYLYKAEEAAEYMHITDELYREKDRHLPTYEEYMATMGIGDTSAALDAIIAMQEELIGT